MPYEPPPALAALDLEAIAAEIAARRLPPVDRWAPGREGESHMRIAANGQWFHDGGPITRPAMVRAFASLLTRDAAGRHWLVTPQERLSIEVEDAAFLAVDCQQHGEALAFRLNTDDLVVAGPAHPLQARGTLDAPAMYLAVRNGCEARLDRSTWLQLAGIALATSPEDAPAVTSNGASFALVPSA